MGWRGDGAVCNEAMGWRGDGAVANHAQQRLGHAEHHRVERDRQDGAGQDQALPFLRHQAQGQAQRGQDKRELADRQLRERIASAAGLAVASPPP